MCKSYYFLLENCLHSSGGFEGAWTLVFNSLYHSYYWHYFNNSSLLLVAVYAINLTFTKTSSAYIITVIVVTDMHMQPLDSEQG